MKKDLIQAEIAACEVMSQMLSGFNRTTRENSNIFKCHNYDDNKDLHLIQRCKEISRSGEPNLQKVCAACRAKYFMDCMDWAVTTHIYELKKKLDPQLVSKLFPIGANHAE